MILLEGPEFINADPKIMSQHLNTTLRENVHLNPANMKMNTDGKFLILQVLNGKVKEYPVRKSFLYKLLNWYSFPISQLHRMSIDTVTSLCNDYLLSIKSDCVNLKTENGEALTLTSPRYSEISDLEVIDMCGALGISNISRNDFFMRIYTAEKYKTDPIPGDTCGFSFNVFNSETGFRALSISHYILRYVCSNGAVAAFDRTDNRRFHFGHQKGDLQKFLNNQIIKGLESRMKLIKQIKASTNMKASDDVNLISVKIDRLLGRNSSQRLLEELKEDSTQYDLFNILTTKAKEYDISKRLYLERIAGELLTNYGR